MARSQPQSSMAQSASAIDSADSGYFIADSGNNAVRIFEPSAPLAPVSAPQIGYVTFSEGPDGTLASVFHTDNWGRV